MGFDDWDERGQGRARSPRGRGMDGDDISPRSSARGPRPGTRDDWRDDRSRGGGRDPYDRPPRRGPDDSGGGRPPSSSSGRGRAPSPNGSTSRGAPSYRDDYDRYERRPPRDEYGSGDRSRGGARPPVRDREDPTRGRGTMAGGGSGRLGPSDPRNQRPARGGALWDDEPPMRGAPGGASDPRSRSRGGRAVRDDLRDPRRGLHPELDEPKKKRGSGKLLLKTLGAAFLMLLLGAGGGYGYHQFTQPTIQASSATPPAATTPASSPPATTTSATATPAKSATPHTFVAPNATGSGLVRLPSGHASYGA